MILFRYFEYFVCGVVTGNETESMILLRVDVERMHHPKQPNRAPPSVVDAQQH